MVQQQPKVMRFQISDTRGHMFSTEFWTVPKVMCFQISDNRVHIFST
jgi:hypothetical protein